MGPRAKEANETLELQGKSSLMHIGRRDSSVMSWSGNERMTEPSTGKSAFMAGGGFLWWRCCRATASGLWDGGGANTSQVRFSLFRRSVGTGRADLQHNLAMILASRRSFRCHVALLEMILSK